MAAQRPERPATVPQLTTGSLLNSDQSQTGRLLSELGDALTDTQRQVQIAQGATAPLFTATTQGEVPASGGASGTYLGADSTFSSPPGRLLGIQRLTGAGVYAPTAGTKHVRARIVGGGGGGGGVGGGAGAAAGGGGNSGWLIDVDVNGGGVDITGGAFSCGAGGAAGSAAPTAGGAGGDSTLIINGVTYTAKGGTGGGSMALAANNASGPAAPAGGSSVVNVLRSTYGQGAFGMVVNTTFWFSGIGGATELGVGGTSVGAVNAGVAGSLGGGGGSGGATNGAAQAGGLGGAGLIIVEEYA